MPPRKSNPDYPETLRLYRKFASHPREPIGQTFTHVAKQLELVRSRPSRRADLAKMLIAWKFWSEMDNSFQSELLDCIEYTYMKP